MKKILFLLAALAYAGLGSAQSIEADTLPTLPPHVYCEITAHHLPTHRNNGVLFDFGQKTEVLKYNYLTDAAGNRLLFNSGIEALNYMVCRGWELVQAYTSGEENSLTHYLLRIAPAYSATKRMQNTYIDALAQLSRMENCGIRFTDIRPGFVATPLLSGDGRYPMLMRTEKVAARIMHVLRHPRRRVVIDRRYALMVFFWKLIPEWLWERLNIRKDD